MRWKLEYCEFCGKFLWGFYDSKKYPCSTAICDDCVDECNRMEEFAEMELLRKKKVDEK